MHFSASISVGKSLNTARKRLFHWAVTCSRGKQYEPSELKILISPPFFFRSRQARFVVRCSFFKTPSRIAHHSQYFFKLLIFFLVNQLTGSHHTAWLLYRRAAHSSQFDRSEMLRLARPLCPEKCFRWFVMLGVQSTRTEKLILFLQIYRCH